MSGKRSYPSGAEKRKRKPELEKTQASLPKLNKYFQKTSNTDALPSTSTATQNFDKPEESSSAESIHTNVTMTIESDNVALVATDDPSTWVVINNALREKIIRRPINQNLIGNYTKSLRTDSTQVRYLPLSIFERKMSNGEKFARKWLVYSPSTGNVFCVPCKLFGTQESAFRSGFSDWKNCHALIKVHESSINHKKKR